MPHPLRAVLQQALSDQGIDKRIDRRLPAHVWEAAVGEGIAARAQATVLTAGVLHVLVQDHRWRDQLDAARSMIIARVNAKLGRPLVRELQFGQAHGGVLQPERDRAPSEPERVVVPPAAEQAAQLPSTVREAFLSAARAYARTRV